MTLTIALDYDRTYTADPVLWGLFIEHAQARGHQMICVTRRHLPPGAHEHPIPVPVVCCGDEWKRKAAQRAGYAVDIWVDDMPEVIDPEQFLQRFTPEELVDLFADLSQRIRQEREDSRSLAEACLAYHRAIVECANDPAKMASFCTAQGERLDQLYQAWLTLATARLDGHA